MGAPGWPKVFTGSCQGEARSGKRNIALNCYVETDLVNLQPHASVQGFTAG
jgi:hypothetical protein